MTERGERERERQGRKRKSYKHKKFMEFYLVVLQSGYLFLLYRGLIGSQSPILTI